MDYISLYFSIYFPALSITPLSKEAVSFSLFSRFSTLMLSIVIISFFILSISAFNKSLSFSKSDSFYLYHCSPSLHISAFLFCWIVYAIFPFHLYWTLMKDLDSHDIKLEVLNSFINSGKAFTSSCLFIINNFSLCFIFKLIDSWNSAGIKVFAISICKLSIAYQHYISMRGPISVGFYMLASCCWCLIF